MVGTLQILQVQIIGNARRAVGGIEGLGFFIGTVVGGLAGQVNFADVVIREARRLQQCVFELGVRNFTVAVRVRLGIGIQILEGHICAVLLLYANSRAFLLQEHGCNIHLLVGGQIVLTQYRERSLQLFQLVSAVVILSVLGSGGVNIQVGGSCLRTGFVVELLRGIIGAVQQVGADHIIVRIQ